jgi:hypothetical protein
MTMERARETTLSKDLECFNVRETSNIKFNIHGQTNNFSLSNLFRLSLKKKKNGLRT